MATTSSEWELVELARSGDDRAFAELAGRHRAVLWSICLRVTRNEYDAEDALQEALTAAWLHLDSFRGKARFSTWVYRIAANASLAVLRRRREIPTDVWEAMPQSGEGDFVDALADRDRINTAIGGLSPQFREALVLREYGDLTYEEIAAHQGVGVQTVKSRLNRARAAVAARLEAPGHVGGDEPLA